MGRHRHLSNAPVQEALIDIKFDSVPERSIALAADALATGHAGSVVDLWQTTFAIELGPNQLPFAQHARGQSGKRIDFPKLRQVVQLQPTSFTSSQLPPYDSWEQMSCVALANWQQFSERAAVKRVTRIAVRYLNVLHLPIPFGDFTEFLISPPLVPDSLPQSLASFLTRTVIPRGSDVAVVTQSSEAVVEFNQGQALKMILDIDVSTLCSLELADFSEIGFILERLRAYKNDVFFSFLTDKTLEMYA